MSNLKEPSQNSLSSSPHADTRRITVSSDLRAPSPSGSASTADHRPGSVYSDTTDHGPSSSISSLERSAHSSHPHAASINDPHEDPVTIQVLNASNDQHRGPDIGGGLEQLSPGIKRTFPVIQVNEDSGDDSDSSDEAMTTMIDRNEESPSVEYMGHLEALDVTLEVGKDDSADVGTPLPASSPGTYTCEDLASTTNSSQYTCPTTTPPPSTEGGKVLDAPAEEEPSLATQSDHEDISQEPIPAAGCDVNAKVEPPTVTLKPPTVEPKPPVAEPEPVGPDDIDPNPDNRFRAKGSPAKQEWERLKSKGIKNNVIDDLMAMVGLEEVKQKFLDIRAKVETFARQGTDLSKERFNIIFQGNPGTGKTTIARLYAQFLHSCNIIGSDHVKETSGAKLASQGPMVIKRKIKKFINEMGGGVLFVDEAYQLTADHSSSGGRQVLDILLTMMENHIGELVVIFVGYNNEMQSFFEHNPGLASRIPYTLQFDDFDDMELWTILRDALIEKYKSKMKITGGMEGLFMRIVIRRLGYGRGFKGFGNARSVHNLLAKISERQARRLALEARSSASDSLDYFRFTKEDLIGPEPTSILKTSAAWRKLKSLVGLKQVKESARNMIEIISTNYLRELKEMCPLNFSLNRVFYGSPGTGKTTVAKLYGKIMAELGLLSNGEVVIKNPSDFIGQCLGKSEAKTRAILASTVGKVLIIDEAYMLNHGGTEGDSKGDSYKMAVIDTLVAEVQSVPGDDRCILILGYEDKLKDMFHNVNPGLSRRFAIEDPFLFQDFDLPQLKEILVMKMAQQHVTATKEGMRVALEILDRARMRPNFCNAGEVDNCLAKAKLNYQARQMKEKDPHKRAYDARFLPEDFDLDYKRSVNAVHNCRKNLEGLVDDGIITRLEGYQTTAAAARACNNDPREQIPTNFVFKGPPGTGKTTTARNMGKVFYDMGFLSTDEVVECSASDLIGQYMGHTGPKTRAYLDKALGKVLFVDEAYLLIEGQYATEAVNEMINRLTNPRYAHKMIVILAGYSQDMNLLMATRPCLSGIFSEEIIFENIKPDACLDLLSRELSERRILAPFLKNRLLPDYNHLLKLMNMLSLFPSWSNARDIKTLAKEMAGFCFRDVLDGRSIEPTLLPEQAKSCTKRMINMLHERSFIRVEDLGARRPISFPPEGEQTASNAPARESAPIAHDSDQELVPAAAPEALGPTTADVEALGAWAQGDNVLEPSADDICLRPLGPDGVSREDSVPDVVWNQLQIDIEAKKRAKQNRKSEEKQREEEIQRILQHSGGCENGYEWIQQSNGYRCAGGAHFISHHELERKSSE